MIKKVTRIILINLTRIVFYAIRRVIFNIRCELYMVEKNLKKLSRADLIELLLEQTCRVEELEKQLELAKEQLDDKTLRITEAGSIAQASLQVNNVFESAQKAAAQYLENIRTLSEKQEEICAKREAASVEAAKQLILYTREKCRMMEQDTKKRCDEMIVAAEIEAEEIREQAQKSFEEFVLSGSDIKALLDGTDSEET